MENDNSTTITVSGMGCGRSVAMVMRDMAARVEIDPDAVDWDAYDEEERGYMIRLIAMRKAFGATTPLVVSTSENGLKIMARESVWAMLHAEIRKAAQARHSQIARTKSRRRGANS